MIQLEICCGSYEDCLAAYNGGAKRVELNSALHLGGLTPSIGSLQLAKRNTELNVIAMVRPRAAGFCYSEEEIEVMMLDAKTLLDYGADGIAFGFLNQDGSIALQPTQQMINIIKGYPNKEVVFHRAFDCVDNPVQAIEQLISLGVDRILTSGLQDRAVEAKELFKELVLKYGDQIEILAGSGINESNVVDFIKATDVKQVHSSCKDWAIDTTTTKNGVTYAYHDKYDYEIVSEEKVRKIITQIKTME